jgi:hypothetical protein
VNRPSAFRRVVLSAALLALAPVVTQAQTAAKPPPRLPPNASETSRIPAGVDTGSPATSGNLELGTPVPPTLGADRGEMRNRSAAARAAARPKISASGPDCTRRVAAADAAAANGAKASPAALQQNPVARGSSAAQTTTLARPTRLDC